MLKKSKFSFFMIEKNIGKSKVFLMLGAAIECDPQILPKVACLWHVLKVHWEAIHLMR